MPHPLFVYGTLEVSAVMREVIGRSLPFSTAAALDHRRSMIRGRVFPGMTPARGRHTVGRLYSGLEPEEFARLDEFESDFYERREITVDRPRRGRETAFAYVVPESSVDILDERMWDRAFFVRHRLHKYLG